MYETLINAEQLSESYQLSDWVILDCRYDLADKTAGREAYLKGHIPGACYVDLHEQLAGTVGPGSGRHPLPTPEQLVEVFSSLGISQDSQVVAYDAASGAFAARAWWLLRFMGHSRVAVLDGGWPAWLAAGLGSENGDVRAPRADFSGEARVDRIVEMEDVLSSEKLVDSREGPRYRGEVEPIDPVAGHIPGALNRSWKDNLDASGTFLDSSELHRQFTDLYADTAAEEVVFYCGSGVTACHNLLALAHAGLPEARLYPGSWSQWCSSKDRPIATGSE